MRAERMVRFGGLALVLLFPLISILQLRDTDRPWRETARRVRPSVLGLVRAPGVGSGGEFAACGVVIQLSPARVVVAGRVSEPLWSLHNGAQIEWQPLHTDVHGEFTVLEIVTPASGVRIDPSSLLSPAKLALDPSGALTNEIEVALVAPKELAEQPLWVGVLSIGAGRNGRLGYFSEFLSPQHRQSRLHQRQEFLVKDQKLSQGKLSPGPTRPRTSRGHPAPLMQRKNQKSLGL